MPGPIYHLGGTGHCMGMNLSGIILYITACKVFQRQKAAYI